MGNPRQRRPAAGTYHHGDLRRALVDATLGLIATEGVPGVSLRRVARDVGVSHMAPYNHFPDKAALVAAAAAEGFRRLREAMERRMAAFTPGDPRHLQAAGVAYARFAAAHPALFRLMFGEELADKRSHPELASEASAVYQTLLGAMAGAGLAARRGAVLGVTPWALVHGIAMLAVAGQIPQHTPAKVEALARDATYLLYVGMAHWPPDGGGEAPAPGPARRPEMR